MLARSQTRIGHLDALRGIAAMMVFMIHAGGWGLRSLGTIGNSIVDHGKYGVTIFFVVSAYCLCLKALPQDVGCQGFWRSFFLKRAFRIIPMYFVAITLAAVYLPSEHSADSWLAHFTFANILLLKYTNDILGVEWSVPVEISFYLLFPVFLIAVRNAPKIAALVTVAIAIPILRTTMHEEIGGAFLEFRQYTLSWHLYAFLLGALTFEASRIGLFDSAKRAPNLFF
ncbi:acyltransferase family protein [Rhizobium sp. F40D2]